MNHNVKLEVDTEKLESIKVHIRENKKVYLAGGFGVAIGLVGGIHLGRVQVINNIHIQGV